MRVRLPPSDFGGCGYYRQREPARVAQMQGVETITEDVLFDIYEAPFGKVVCSVQRYEGEDRVVEWQEDVVVLQRPAQRVVVDAIPVLQARGVAVVVDIDDDLSSLHPQNSAFRGYQPKQSPDRNFEHTHRACQMADLVTVTTQALADRYAHHGRVVVLPNCVPAAILDLPRMEVGKTVGWTGTRRVHPTDLEQVRGGLAEFLDCTDWRFHMIGEADGVAQALGIRSMGLTGYLEMPAYHIALGMFDVGIVPLEANRFNLSKSYLKGLEFGARGVPFVASGTPEYIRLAEEGWGLLCDSRGRSWRRALMRLSDDTYRAEMAANARDCILDHHTYESQGWRWCEAWEQAMDNRALDFERAAALS